MGKVFRRIGLAVLVSVVFAVVSLYATLYAVAHGPSPTVRDILILAAKQASATRWIPGLFFDDAFIQQIVDASEDIYAETIQIADLLPVTPAPRPTPSPAPAVTPPEDGDVPEQTQQPEPTPGPTPEPDPWDDAIDGMLFDTYLGPTFKAYVLLVKDPSRVFTAKCKGEFSEETPGVKAYEVMEDESIIALINGGGFYDPVGLGSGGLPLGLTYSGGECVWEDGSLLSFIGFDRNDRLVAERNFTPQRAEALGIRDGVCFQNNSVLIRAEKDAVTAYYSEADRSLSQRTAIGQTADGTVILMVTEGRTAAYLGANRNDIINAMLHYDAVTAAMLDGGASSVMCYRGYYEKYGIDVGTLNKYQKMGLINNTRTFLDVRKIPTYFAVRTNED